MENDLLTFLPNKLKFEDYSNDFINIFYRNFVNQKPSGNPYLEFNYNYEENSCNPVNITLSQITNDAKRKFLHLNWTLEQFNGSDEQQKKLLEILKAASQNKNTSLLIEPQFIPPNQNITFKFSYLLKVNKTGSQVFTIFYLKQKIIRISYQQSNYPPLYRYMGLSFYIQFYVEVCQLGEIAYYHEPVDMQIDSSQLPSLSLSSYNSSSYQYDILPFSLASNQTLNTTVIFRVNLSSDKKVISVQNISVDILITNLQLQIEGGSSLIVGFQNKLELNTVYRDYEIEDANSPQNIRFTWSCYGLSFSDHLCYDFSNKIIELQQDVSSLSFPAKTFSPYTIIVLTISGSKDSRETTSSTTCIFTELDIPSLLVKYQPSQQSSKINLNEDLDFTIVYGGNISSDVLSYAGALLYQNNVVGTIKFDYFQVKLRVWNYYQNIIPGQPTIQIRFSVYNPSYVMPSLSTLSFIVNIPPSNCDLIVEPMQGIALQTVFSIELLNCNDEDLPLTYQFFYYNNEDDAKQELVSPWNITRRQIQDQSVKKSIKTILPQGNLTIMGQVMDCQFGISNKTLKIEVQSQNKLVDPYFFIANNLVQQALSIQSSNQYADQIINLSIIGEDLSKQQFSFSQKISQLQSFLIETIQKLTEQLPKFSLLNTFANKVIAELSKQLFDSQQNDYSTQKKDIFNQLQKIILETKQSVTNNKQSTLEQNNDVSMQNVIDSFKILNSSVTLSSKNSFEDFEEYDQISSQIGLLLTNMSLPNQGQLILQGNFSSLLADKITEKNMFQYTLPFEGQNSQNKTNIYSITRNNYKINIYENTTSFLEYTQSIKNISSDFVFSKNQLISTLIYNSDQSQLGFSNLNAQDGSNKIKNVLRGLQNVKSTVKNTDLENTSLDLNEDVSIIYQFDNVIQSDKYKMTCLQQSQTKWNKDNCGFYQKDKNNYMCFCNKQQPVTIIEDIDDMFTKNKNLQTAFGEQGFENISNFNNFYLYLSFWSLFTFSLAQVAFYFIGKYLDQKSFSKKFQQIHIEQPNKSDKSNEQQEQSQEQEQKKIEMNDKQLSVIPELNDQNESKISNQVTFNQNPLEQQIEDQQCAAGQEKLDSKTSSDQTTAKKLITITEQPTLISLTQFNQQNAEVNNLNEKNNESTENNNIKKIEEETPSSEVNPQIENTETQDEQEKSQLEQIYSKLSKYKKLLIFHQLLSIFYLYDTTMPRPMRFTLIYIKIIHTLAIAVLFAGYTKFFQQLIIALLNSILLQTFSFLIIFAFKRGSKGKYISTFLQIGISLSYYYIILAVSSGKSPGESNQFMILFIVSVIFEQIVTEFLMCYLKNVLVLKYISSNEEEEENIYKKLFGFLDLQQTLLSIDL